MELQETEPKQPRFHYYKAHLFKNEEISQTLYTKTIYKTPEWFSYERAQYDFFSDGIQRHHAVWGVNTNEFNVSDEPAQLDRSAQVKRC